MNVAELRMFRAKKPPGKQSAREAKAGLPVRGQPGLHYIKKQANIQS